MEQALVQLMLFGLPFVVGWGGVTETAKVMVAEIGVGILVIMRIWKPVKIESRKMWTLYLMAGWVILRTGDWLGNGSRLQGGFLTLILILWALLATKIVERKWAIGSLIGLIGVAMAVESNVVGRAVGTLGEPNALAGVAVFAWPWMGLWGWWCAIVVAMLAGSRSGLVALGIQGLLWVIVHKFRMRMGLAVSWMIVLSLASLILPFADRSRVWENRLEIWHTALVAGLEKPVGGWGFGQVELALQDAAGVLKNNVRYERVDSAHNLFLDWWVSGGVFGLGLLILMIGLVMRGFIGMRDVPGITAFLGLLVTMSFNPASVAVLVPFWWLVGRGMDRKFTDHRGRAIL